MRDFLTGPTSAYRLQFQHGQFHDRGRRKQASRIVGATENSNENIFCAEIKVSGAFPPVSAEAFILMTFSATAFCVFSNKQLLTILMNLGIGQFLGEDNLFLGLMNDSQKFSNCNA